MSQLETQSVICSAKKCDSQAQIRVHYLPLRNKPEDPRSLCFECYNKKDSETGVKFYQSGIASVEVLKKQ